VKLIGIHPAAEAEIWAELAYYDAKRAGLGRELKLEIRAAFARIQQHPRAFAADRRRVRRCLLKRFPFSVVYRDEPDAIWVIALAHHKRRPNYWRNRLN
jgi:plasmid stabilization system protein ParE